MSPGAAGLAPRVAFGALADDYRGKRAAIDAAVARVLERGWFILGEEVARFEEEFARSIGVAHVVACANGTEAIALALAAAGARPGRRGPPSRPTPAPRRSPASGMAGARPGPRRRRSRDADARRRAAPSGRRTPRRSSCCPSTSTAASPTSTGSAALAARRGARRSSRTARRATARAGAGRATGSFGRAAAFSFYPSKNLGAYGDGGAVATGDAERRRARCAQLRQYGWSRRDYAEREGWNSRLDEIQAAILRAKLPFLERENARRREIAGSLRRRVRGPAAAAARASRPGASPARHLYPVRLDAPRRAPGAPRRARHRDRRSTTRCRSTSSRPTRSSATARGDFPVSEAACDTRRLAADLSRRSPTPQVDAVIAAVRDFFEAARDERATLVSVVVPVYFNAESLPRLAERLKRSPRRPTTTSRSSSSTTARATPPGTRIQEIARDWPARARRPADAQLRLADGDRGGPRARRGARPRPSSRPTSRSRPSCCPRWSPPGAAARPPSSPCAAAGPRARDARRRRLLLPDAAPPRVLARCPSGGFDCFLIGRPAIDFLVESREIHTSLPGLLLWGGFPTALVPYDRVAREEGESRWTFAKKLKYFLDAVISFSYAPLRWMSVAGAVLALARLRLRRLPRRLQARPRPADPGLDLADGRARVLLGRAAALARHPRRVPLAHARRRAGAQGLPGPGADRPAGALGRRPAQARDARPPPRARPRRRSAPGRSAARALPSPAARPRGKSPSRPPSPRSSSGGGAGRDRRPSVADAALGEALADAVAVGRRARRTGGRRAAGPAPRRAARSAPRAPRRASSSP